VLSTRDKTKQIINTISKWTDAFIGTSFKIPSIIEMYAHCALGFGVRGLAWKIYDEQFRVWYAP
jgi:hypothetical protein